MRPSTTLAMLSTLAFAGGCGFYFLEYQKARLDLAAYDETVQHYRDQQQMFDSQIDKLKADSANAGILVERAREEARQWRERAETAQNVAPAPSAEGVPEKAGAAQQMLRARLEEALRPWIRTKAASLTEREGLVVVTVPASLMFAQGGVEVVAQGKELLTGVAQTASGTARVRALVHTDDSAPAGGLREKCPTNWELSAARAAGVVRNLIEAGIPSAQIEAVALAESVPVAPNDSADNRARNRRLEMLLAPIPQTDMAGEPKAAAAPALPVGDPVKLPAAPLSPASEKPGLEAVAEPAAPATPATALKVEPIPEVKKDGRAGSGAVGGPRPILDD